MSKVKKALKIVLIILLVIILVALAYVAYVFIDYDRIEDNQKLTINDNIGTTCEVGTEYKITAYNVGFGAYRADFGFFMDGGKESRAKSAESVNEAFDGITAVIKEQDPDFMMFEEVDVDADRSWHINQKEILENAFTGYDSAFGINYDSAFLMYPVFKPHGKSLSGIATFSRFNMTSSLRRSLPIETSARKIVDLDRCYTVSRVPTSDGNELVLYTVHLSAYTSDGSVATKQLKMLLTDMQGEYDKGNYCIAGGDFNKDLLGDGKVTSADIFGVDDGGYT
ncbi:MAG: endonuclease/exonuclease/phosphatase family protein, partial [Clostridia bacterium]|nr:endonuclease/exonuclease/phosphatase family protein [Clostridia bacterium]